MKKVIALAILPLVLILSACTTGASHADPKASSAPASVNSPATKVNPLLKGFGDVITYTDGVSISVSTPTPYSPSVSAAGAVVGANNVVFTIVITNHSKKQLDIYSDPSANSGGTVASEIMDYGSNVGMSPSTTLLVGQTVQWQAAFSVANPADITFEVSPGMDYDNAIFDSKH